EVMVMKHVHAIVLTELHRLSRASSLGETERTELIEALRRYFPNKVREYLFESNGEVRHNLPDLEPLPSIITRHLQPLHASVMEVFRQGWPEEAARVVDPAILNSYIGNLDCQLALVLERLKRRLDWSVDQLNRLDVIRRRQGTLDPEQDALRNR